MISRPRYHKTFHYEFCTRTLFNQNASLDMTFWLDEFLFVKLKSPLRKFYGRHHDLVDRYGISVSQMTTDMFHLSVNTSRSFPHSWLITVFVTILTRWVSLVEQELLTLPEHLSSPPDFSGVRVTRSLVLYVCFADRCLSFCTFSFGHCLFFFDIRILVTHLVSSNSS